LCSIGRSYSKDFATETSRSSDAATEGGRKLAVLHFITIGKSKK
jgi:hypothetical protein